MIWFYVDNEEPVDVQKFKDQDTQIYNSARCPVWVWNLVADIDGGT